MVTVGKLWNEFFGLHSPRYATPRGAGKYGLGRGVPLPPKEQVIRILEAGNESWTGQEMLNKLFEAGFVVVPLKPTSSMLEKAKPYMDSWSSNMAWWDAMLKGAQE